MTYRFGPFQFALAPYRLLREGQPIEITPQQAQLLEILISDPGEIVSREVIRERLWPDDVHVDYNRGINYGVARLRAALGDRSEDPRYIETVPRRGYRFVSVLEPEAESPKLPTPPTPLTHDGDVEPRFDQPSPSPSAHIYHPALPAVVAFLGLMWWGLRALPASPDRSSPPNSEPMAAEACDASSQPKDISPLAAAALRRGRHFAPRTSVEDRGEAIAAFDEVLAHHPDFEPAISCQARLFAIRHEWSRAEPMAQRAMELAPNRVDAHLILAEASFRHHFDWPQAEARFQAALKLHPHHEELRVGYASLLSAMGRSEEAVALAQETARLHPLSLRARSELAEELYLAHDFAAAEIEAERVVQVDPWSTDAFFTLLYSRMASSDPSAVLAVGNRMLNVAGSGPAPASDLESFWGLIIKHQSYGDYPDQNQLSELAMKTWQVGRRDEARRLMERACAERSGWSLPYYDVAPRFRAFHQFPGLQSLEVCLRGPFNLGRAGKPGGSATSRVAELHR